MESHLLLNPQSFPPSLRFAYPFKNLNLSSPSILLSSTAGGNLTGARPIGPTGNPNHPSVNLTANPPPSPPNRPDRNNSPYNHALCL